MANLGEALKTLDDVKKKVREAVKVNQTSIKKEEKIIKKFTEETQANKKDLTKYMVRVFLVRESENAIKSLKEINSLFDKYLEKPSKARLREAVIAYHVFTKKDEKRGDNKKEFQIFEDGFKAGYKWLRDDLQPQKK